MVDRQDGLPVRPVRQTAWWNASCILIAELVGTGVLGLPYTFDVLGGAVGGAFLLLFGALAYYSGILLWRLHHTHPNAVTYPDLASDVGGSTTKGVVFVFLYVAFFGNLAIYIVICRGALSAMIEGLIDPCQTTLSLVVMVVLFPVAQLKTLHGVSFVALGSTICVFVAVMLIVSQGISDLLAQRDLPEAGHGAHFGYIPPSSSSLLKAFSASTTAVFAFGGQGLYLETMAEMRNPYEFRKSLRLSSVGILLFYVVTSTISYVRYGDNIHGNVLDNLETGPLKKTVAALLFLHVAVSYTLASQVVCRAIAVRTVPHLVDRKDRAEKRAWMGITTLVLFVSWFIAEGIPFFHLLMGLVGAASTAPLTFGFPAWFWLKTMDTRRKGGGCCSRGEAAFLLGAGTELVPKEEDRSQLVGSESERPLLWVMISVTFILFFLGMLANTVSLVEKWSEQGRPFACHT
mmetsp:Transcript_6872/g.14312  ORF Transcript_6872/g.14312 Transcript_6872/m.14312 type:complete len:460 (-) Transcript_6872:52-1431(-)